MIAVVNKRRFVFLIAAAVYTTLFWRRLLLLGCFPMNGDTMFLYYPSWVIGKKLLMGGFSFLWDPYRNMGQPFLAAPFNTALYPFRFFSLFLNFIDYQRLFVVSHTLLAAGFAYAVATRWTREESAGLIAAVGVGFNGFALARVGFGADFATMSWASAALYFLLCQRPILLGLCLTMAWLAGFPPFFLLIIVFLVIGIFLSEDQKKSAVTLLKGTLLFLGLSAVQLLPFLEMMKESNRPLILSNEVALAHSLAAADLLKQLFLSGPFLGASQGSLHAVSRFYIGPIFLALLLMALLRGGRREKLLSVSAVFFLLLSMGERLPFYSHMPFFKIFRFPGNWLFLFTLCAVFAASGALRFGRASRWPYVIFGAIALDLLLYAIPSPYAWGNEQAISEVRTCLTGLEAAPGSKRIFHTERALNRIRALKNDSAESWKLYKGILLPSYGASFGFREVFSPTNLMSRRAAEFQKRLNVASAESPLVDAAGIGLIVDASRSFRDSKKLDWTDFQTIPNPNPKQRAFLVNLGGTVQVRRDHPGEFIGQALGPGTVVFSETAYPGWRVDVDGKKGTLHLYENTFLAVDIGPGDHVIRFVYHPSSFFWGAALSGCTAAGLLLWAFFIFRKREVDLLSIASPS